ncbi:MAG: hypothetical protein RR370_03500 [Synergistaceae bacterium]
MKYIKPDLEVKTFEIADVISAQASYVIPGDIVEFSWNGDRIENP